MSSTSILHKATLVAAAGLIAVAFGVKPVSAMGTDNPPPPKQDSGSSGKKSDQHKSQKKKKKNDNSGSLERKFDEAKFLDGYRAARELILAGEYKAGIDAMHALGHDEHPDVANYIGYAFRKLGDYDDSKVWYEKALAADPNHVRTWSYYGMWQMEQGNRLKAEDFLQKVKAICGDTSCKEYVELKAVIDGTGSY